MKEVLWLALISIGVAVIIAVVIAKSTRGRATASAPWPFYVKQLLTQPEQVLFHRLRRALPDHIVLAQVQVSRVLGVQEGFNDYEWSNLVNRLSYDFVVCKKDGSVVLAIELDDSSHDAPSRQQTDARKDKAALDAGLRLIRWHVQFMPSEDDIRETFAHPDWLVALPEDFLGKNPTLRDWT